MVYTKSITPTVLKRKKFSRSFLRISNKKKKIGNLIHSAWENYEKEIYNILINKDDLKIRDFEKLLIQIRNKVINSFPNKIDIQEVSLFLHKLILKIRKLVKRISINSKIKVKDFLTLYFEGVPEFEKDIIVKVKGILIHGRIDQLISTPQNKIIIKDLKPDFNIEQDIHENTSLFQIAIYAYLAEIRYLKICEKIVLIDYKLQTQEILFNNNLREQTSKEIDNLLNEFKASNLIKEKKNKAFQETYNQITYPIKKYELSAKTSKQLDSNINIGWCVARRSKKPNLSIRSLNKIRGYIEDTQKLKVIPGIYVVIEFHNNTKKNLPKCNGNVRIISKILNIKPFIDTISLIKNSMSENIIEVEIEPLYEISEEDGHFGQVRPHIFDKANIRFCTDEEIIELLKVPRKGFEIGEIEGYGDREIKYKLPYKKLDESICILGTQGTGKTTLISCLVTKFRGDLNLEKRNRPAIVILDIESEYSNLGTMEFKLSNEGFIKNYEISEDFNINKYKIGYHENDFTLDLSLIDPEEYIYFIPNLTTKTTEAFIKIAKEIRETLISDDRFSKENLLKGIKDYVQTGRVSYLHASTLQAIIRVCDSKNFELFDVPKCQKLSIFDLIKPGLLTIIDIFDLSDQEQRIIALYFMLVFYRTKMKSKNKKQNTLALVIDEAHRIFPRISNISGEKEYIDRIVSKVGEITHRGRKRQYGVIFATQSPKDLKKEIITTCNTKIFFRIAGETLLLSEILEKHIIKEIQNLPIGVGIVSCQGVHNAIKIRFPNIEIKFN